MNDKPMTAERLAEIRTRLEAATPGPWALISDPNAERENDIDIGIDDDGPFYRHIATVPDGALEGSNDGIEMEQVANARLIAQAPEDIRALLAEVERLWAEKKVDNDRSSAR